ncbi:hypothetical protein KAU43_06255 [candidate division WOR-3 bacterium]|nr:hypothetical protein [candidate division WOR-3 bacterium]
MAKDILWVVFIHRDNNIHSIHKTKKEVMFAKREYDKLIAMNYGTTVRNYIAHNGEISVITKYKYDGIVGQYLQQIEGK